MIAERVANLAEVARLAAEEGSISFPLRDFLDGFYASPSPARLAEEPRLLCSELHDDGFADAYLAAACDHLCRRYRFQRPAWVKSAGRILSKPYFAAKTLPLRMVLLQESPPAFRERNIFVSANALSRA